MTGEGSLTSRRTMRERVDAFIGYDESKRDEVETAYDLFIWYGRPGYHIAWAVVLSIVVFVAIPYGDAGALVLRTLLINAISLAGFAVPVFLTPAIARNQLVRGAIDLRRACVLVVPIAVVIACLEFAVSSVFAEPNPVTAKVPLAIMIVSVAWVLVMALTAAPILEEFAFQGWLQTRLRGLGGAQAAVITTVVFVLYHGPKTLLGTVRVGNLAFAAYLRARTGSLGLCMIAHFCNNVVVYGLGIAQLALVHHNVHG